MVPVTHHRTEGPGLGEFDAAVLGSIKRGATDPARIVSNLVKRHGESWLVAALTELTTEVAEERTRDLLRAYRLNAERRASRKAKGAAATKSRKPVAERLVVLSTDIPTDELADVPVHIPGRGNVLYGDCTSDDMRTRAAMYDRIAGRNSKRGHWCLDVASKIDAEQAGTLRNLSSLPPLPNGEEPGEMGEEATG